MIMGLIQRAISFLMSTKNKKLQATGSDPHPKMVNHDPWPTGPFPSLANSCPPTIQRLQAENPSLYKTITRIFPER